MHRPAGRAVLRRPCDDCGENLYCRADDLGRPVAGVLTCRACGQRYDAADRRGWLLAAAEDHPLTAAEIAQAIPALHGRQISVHTIRSWINCGRLLPRAWLHQGVIYADRQADGDRPLCRVGDVIDLAEARLLRDSPNTCSTGWVAEHACCVDLWASGQWCRAGVWYAELPAVTAAGTVEQGLRYYLDHHATLDGPRWYRVRVDESDTPLVELVYQRTGPPPWSLRKPTDRRPYVCPHCCATLTVDNNPSDVLYEWCPACERFADGCTRGQYQYEHVQPD